MRVQLWIIAESVKVAKDQQQFTLTFGPQYTLRPNRVVCDVSARGLVTIHSFRVSRDEQLAQSIDAYEWSAAHMDEVRKAAEKRLCKEYGLLESELDAFLDDNDMAIPDPSRVDMPTIAKGSQMRVRGTYHGDVPLMFIMAIQGRAYGLDNYQ